jgi:hypothetical protein
MTTFNLNQYVPAGPEMVRFHASSAFHRRVAGPIGSGKTTAAGPIEAVITAMMQRPDANGVRWAPIGLLRDTYRNMYRTMLPTWWKIFPRDLGEFVGSDDRPAMHKLSFPAPLLDKFGQPTREMGMCELEASFNALGSNNTVESVCRGWEIVYAYLDEEDLMPMDARTYLGGRVLRGADNRYRVSRGVTGCFNKPDVDHPLYHECVEAIPDGYEFFDQPGGLLPGGPPYRTNPAAENLANLHGYADRLPDADCYYPMSARGQPEHYIRRMLRNEWGASYAGDPIYGAFNRAANVCAAELEPNDGDELILGLDGGGTPAGVVIGRTPTGRRIQYAEIVLTDPTDPRGMRLLTGVGPKRFGQAIRDALWPRFRRCRITLAYGDPAAFYGADRAMGEYSFMEIVGNVLEIPVLEAPSNENHLRIEAVAQPLGRANPIDGQRDLMINPSCRHTIRGFASDYKWEPPDPKQPGKNPKPQKSATSHVHDALQYACLGDQGRAGVTVGRRFDRHYVSSQPGASQEAGQSLWREHEHRVAGERGGNSYGGGDFDVWRS